MMHVALCISQEHDFRLVLLAVLVCFTGSAATVQLFARNRAASGISRWGWIILTAVGAGTMVWCTHFVAMMAFHAAAPVVLDPTLTLLSLVIAIVAAAPGIALAARRTGYCGAAGGALIGASIAAMHYTGMAAYRVDGMVEWDWRYIAASVALSCGLASAAFHVLCRRGLSRRVAGGALLGVAVAALHFTGMAAMTIRTLVLHDGGLSAQTMNFMAIATAFAGLLVIGCAAVSAIIDGHTQTDTFRRLRRMALHDGLTDLPNRTSFNEELNRRLTRRGGKSGMAVVMLDLSRFKSVNDTYGHKAGDQLLIALSARLTKVADCGECIARLGGDEFAALISYDAQEELDAFLAAVTGVFAAPFTFERFGASIGANVGVALAPADGNDADTLMAKADLAMYRAKTAHSTVPCFYAAEMDESVRDRRELANDLRSAIAAEAFQLHFQVQADTASGEISGYEVLVRWTHPTRGAVPPNLFVPLAEEIGEIIPLSNWILRQACFEAALWPNRHVIAVNLSPLQLSDPSLIATVQQALHASGLPPERLALELTESAIIRDRNYALAQLRALKEMGVSLALDDFGVGYSSIDVLRSFPFDKIKLDASFVAEIEKSEQAVSILRAVASLGASLHIPVLAEGIEVREQLAIVAQEGCSAIQGYLIGKPSRALADPAVVKRVMTPAQAQKRLVQVA